MPRRPRIILPGMPHHVTQRGTRRGRVFFSDTDRATYLRILRSSCEKFSVEVRAYCLMDNHVHHALVPASPESLSLAVSTTHRRYSQMVNAREGWTGHLWEGRYFSCALDEDYFWTTVRYIEQNPVEAGIVGKAWEYKWSSALFHVGRRKNEPLMKDSDWRPHHKREPRYWRQFLTERESPQKTRQLLDATRRDHVCAEEKSLKKLEKRFEQCLQLNPRGRPPKKK